MGKSLAIFQKKLSFHVFFWLKKQKYAFGRKVVLIEVLYQI